jgi:hypothetical protein
MMDLNIELGDEVIERIKAIATSHYGNNRDSSVSRVVESALEMRLLSIRLIDKGRDEIEEPIAHWQFVNNQPTEQLPEEILSQLFRKGGSRCFRQES